jgi:hypothetical protein
MQCGKQQTL